MNQEKMFKGKRISDRKWVEGDLSHCVVVGETHILRIEDNLSTTIHKIDPETVCQNSGLPDKIGNNLFVNDIVAIDDVVGVIKFGTYENGFHYGFYIEWTNFLHYRQELAYWNHRVKRIGNTFDNPELVEKK